MGEVIELSDATKVADVVPLWDSVLHDVPGGYLGEHGEGYTSPHRWFAIDTGGRPRLVQCPCRPSVQVHREGAHIGAVVVHHAFDGRTNGTTA
ncbi:hypothetical protein [Actinomycetospora termitidis]|uniref:Uncharacterized protein n=1 Tax=Actinomycetospora termitidis TaxID=3053470 RepID=A0ABT7MJ93_9PSEU|nr:hypothetical protein [Actinomycetospora sp. Odt1-22]MDL5159433.1 hypothetical protein [Actinomycetospora sp. Odt1-22]